MVLDVCVIVPYPAAPVSYMQTAANAHQIPAQALYVHVDVQYSDPYARKVESVTTSEVPAFHAFSAALGMHIPWRLPRV